jgi:D-glycero-D-manno-heptose 1,7-bisphosphate phosphatase
MSFIILDRDGVINYDSDEYIKSPEEWIAIPGSLAAIGQLNRHGFRVAVATNQSGVGRGYYTLETLSRIHEKLTKELAEQGGHIEQIFFCPHRPDECCICRKPKPGMLYQIQAKFNINFSETFFIGDSDVDVLAAEEAGCKPILLMTKKGKLALEKYPAFASVPQFPNLAAAVEYVLALQGNQ